MLPHQYFHSGLYSYSLREQKQDVSTVVVDTTTDGAFSIGWSRIQCRGAHFAATGVSYKKVGPLIKSATEDRPKLFSLI